MVLFLSKALADLSVCDGFPFLKQIVFISLPDSALVQRKANIAHSKNLCSCVIPACKVTNFFWISQNIFRPLRCPPIPLKRPSLHFVVFYTLSLGIFH